VEGVIAVVAVVGSTVVAGEVEVDISEDSLDVHFPAGFPDVAHLPTDFPDAQCPADFPVAGDLAMDLIAAVADLIVEELHNMRPLAARGAIAEEDMLRVATAEHPMEAGFRDTTTEATIIPEDTTEATTDTIIGDMPHMEQRLGSSLAG
jgi:hypothetical protein